MLDVDVELAGHLALLEQLENAPPGWSLSESAAFAESFVATAPFFAVSAFFAVSVVVSRP